MINEKVAIFDSKEDLYRGFSSFLKEELSKKEKVTLCLSGGTTPKSLFEYWAANEKHSIAWNRVLFFWGDERCVPPNDPMSNYGMTRDLLFDKIERINDHQIYRIIGENNPSEEAKRYAGIIDKYVEKKNGIPSFDITMLGLGDDGHTVSIFPDQIGLWDDPNNCIVAKHPETGMQRVSLNGTVVNNSRNIAFLVTGQGKAEKVKQIIKERDKYNTIYPAAKVVPRDGTLTWFIDRNAAGLL